jgi:AraC-like DNA-binding protein
MFMQVPIHIELPNGQSIDHTFKLANPHYAPVFQQMIMKKGKLSREAAAGLVHWSSSHFSHNFRTEFSCSFRSAQALVRLHLAALYLISTETRVSELADWLGYSDPKKFGEAFRRCFAMSPRKYRQTHRDLREPLGALQKTFAGEAAASTVSKLLP